MITNNNTRYLNEDVLKKIQFAFALMVLTALFSVMAHAGMDTTFDGWVDAMTAWIEGSLGKGISIAFVVVGIVMGVVRQSLISFAIGVGCALGLNYTPAVINGMFTAFM
jgi:conjugal transfer pilus assembly protein TraA